MNPKAVKKDDLMALVNYVKVEKVKNISINGKQNTSASVVDVDTGVKFDINGDPVLEKMFSADQYSKSEKKTETQLAEILTNSWNVPMTVNFDKKDGTNRTLRGRLASSEHLLGRSMMVDLDLDIQKDPSRGLRQVDHRTIHYIIVNDVKYIKK